MAGVYKLDIRESLEDLKALLRSQKTASDKERVQLLYLLKSEQVQTIAQAASLLGRNRVTLQKWARQYRQGGLSGLLSHRPRTGRHPKIPKWAQDALKQRLEEPEGFGSYGEICQWLETQLGIVADYKTVHKLAHYQLNFSPRSGRAQNTKVQRAKMQRTQPDQAAPQP